VAPRELWSFRELIYFLIWRDIKIRYRQTALGIAWALLQPALTIILFTLVLGRWAGLGTRSHGIPYSLYVLAGLLPWAFFASALTNCSSSIVGSSHLITKVYFPRIFIPLSAMGSGLCDLVVSLPLLFALMAYHGRAPSSSFLLAFLFLLATVFTTAGLGAVLAALMVRYRDVKFIVPFVLQLWMFATPVVYPSSLIPERWQLVFALNPLAGLIDGFRSSVLSLPIQWRSAATSLVLSVIVLLAGLSYFSREERKFADVI
jgi:lipopolysaccharide transport system permease protein